ncbi:MAG: hypothetical protein HYR96_08315 [Deltaproteobacteria bacterium]|nr:hypothetical protein [Deltaproteobacteria bacterium]MBI3294968.1 hypothetical protein [Deltaproteobacteria bacterium]
MAETVYLLCAITSTAAAGLLSIKYRQRRIPLLLWTTICFTAFALNNILLYVDLVMVPQVNLVTLRTSVMLMGFLALLYGMIWERV